MFEWLTTIIKKKTSLLIDLLNKLVDVRRNNKHE